MKALALALLAVLLVGAVLKRKPPELIRTGEWGWFPKHLDGGGV